jgi:hypothetical protein
MTWIESHASLGDHPKLYALADALHIGEAQAVGHLHYLWWWATENAQDGRLSIPERGISRAMRWKGNAAKLVDALVDAGFVDRCTDGQLCIHDWMDYAGKLILKRKEHVARTLRASGAQVARTPYRTVPDPTGQYRTGPDRSTYTAAEPPASASEGHEPDIQTVYAHYRERIQPLAKQPPRPRIAARLRDYSAAELCLAIDHFADDAWEMEHNAHRGADWFFKSPERMEGYVRGRSQTTSSRANGVAPGNHPEPDDLAEFRVFGA